MRVSLVLAGAVLVLGLVAPAGASPGYWLDICHGTGAVPIVQQSTGFKGDAQCSADPWVQGYGGTGMDAWVLVEVNLYNESGQQIAHVEEGLRPTGAHWEGLSEGRLYGSIDGRPFVIDVGDLSVDR